MTEIKAEAPMSEMLSDAPDPAFHHRRAGRIRTSSSCATRRSLCSLREGPRAGYAGACDNTCVGLGGERPGSRACV